jgi:hypothetical protein
MLLRLLPVAEESLFLIYLLLERRQPYSCTKIGEDERKMEGF